MKRVTYIITWIAIVATLWFGIDAMGETRSFSAFLILFVVIIPYLLGLWLLRISRVKKVIRLVSGIVSLLAIAGVYMLYRSLVLYPDAQSGMVFLVLPVYQFPVMLLTAAAVWIMQRAK